MKIFITGATGFIGANLAKRLAHEGHEVVAMFRSPEKAKSLTHPNIQKVKGDLMDKDSMLNGLKGCDQVYHLAAFAQVWAKNPKTFHDINVKGTVNVIEAAIANNVKRIVVTSTAGVLGPSPDINTQIHEESIRTGAFFNEYEETKAEAEEVAKKYLDKIEIVTVNPTRVFGPGMMSKSNAVTDLIKKYTFQNWKFIPGNGKTLGNYVFVEDVLNGHILAMEKGKSGERYLIGGDNVSYDQFFNILSKVSGQKRKMYHIPYWILLTASRMQMLKTKLFGKPPLITPAWVRRFLHHWSISSEKAKKELGYSITPLSEGMAKTIEWLKNEKNN